MPGLLFIPGVSQPSALLLEAAGIHRPQDLARQDPATLLSRLQIINQSKRFLADGLTLPAVQRWVGNAKGFVERAENEGPVEAGDFSINLDEIPEVIVLDEPVATKMPPSYYRPAKPAPEFGKDFTKIAAKRAAANAPKPEPTGEALPVQPHLTAANDPDRLDPEAPVWKTVEKTKFRDFNSYANGESGITPLPRYSAEEEEAQAEAARVKLNPGEPLSRSVRRGVPHPRPWFVLAGGLIVLLWRFLFLAVLVGIPLTLIPAFTQNDREPLINFLWVVGAWLLVSLLYLAVSIRVRCRVCTNPIYVSKRCFKNVKAHRVFGLGLVGSLAMHAVLFQWFRCMYCGTAIRLKFDGTAGKK